MIMIKPFKINKVSENSTDNTKTVEFTVVVGPYPSRVSTYSRSLVISNNIQDIDAEVWKTVKTIENLI